MLKRPREESSEPLQSRGSSINYLLDAYRHINKKLEAGDYSHLEQWRESTPSPEKEAFFEKYGEFLVALGISKIYPSQSLRFIIDSFPKDRIKQILTKKDYTLLRVALSIQAKDDSKSGCSQTKNSSELIEKLVILLKIDSQGIKNFIETQANEDYMTPAIKSYYAEALKRAEGKNKSTNPSPKPK